jgi:hypothetical protein
MTDDETAAMLVFARADDTLDGILEQVRAHSPVATGEIALRVLRLAAAPVPDDDPLRYAQDTAARLSVWLATAISRLIQASDQ